MSRVPEVLDALVTAFRASPGLQDVEVTDGPQMSNSTASDWICVGYDGDPEGEFQSAHVELDWTALSAKRGESMQIPVTVIVSRGSTEIKPARDDAFAYYETISALMPTLKVPQTRVAIGVNGFYQIQDKEGVHIRLALTVVADTLG